MSAKLRIILDTSGLNALADDVDSAALTSGIKEGFFVRITTLNAMEIAATTDDKRKKHSCCCATSSNKPVMRSWHITG